MQVAAKRFRRRRRRDSRVSLLALALLRLDGLGALFAAIVVYLDQDYSVLALVLLFLLPDVSFIGYLAPPSRTPNLRRLKNKPRL